MTEQLKEVPSSPEESENIFWLAITLDDIAEELVLEINVLETNEPDGKFDRNKGLPSKEKLKLAELRRENLELSAAGIETLLFDDAKLIEDTQKIEELLKYVESRYESKMRLTQKNLELQEELRNAEAGKKELQKSLTQKNVELQKELRNAEDGKKELQKSLTQKNLELQRELRNAQAGKKYANQKVEELYEENEDYQTKLKSVEDSSTRKSEDLKVKYELLEIAVNSIRSLKAAVTSLQKKSLTQKNEELQGKLGNAEADKKRKSDELKAKNELLRIAARSIRSLKTAVTSLRSELQEKKKTCEELKKELDETNNAFVDMKKNLEKLQEFNDSAEVKYIKMKKEIQELMCSSIKMKKEIQELMCSSVRNIKMKKEIQELMCSSKEMKQEIKKLKDEVKEQKSGGSQSHPL